MKMLIFSCASRFISFNETVFSLNDIIIFRGFVKQKGLWGLGGKNCRRYRLDEEESKRTLRGIEEGGFNIRHMCLYSLCPLFKVPQFLGDAQGRPYGLLDYPLEALGIDC
jgi:hypothetical protein